jgi:hypothetical protein
VRVRSSILAQRYSQKTQENALLNRGSFDMYIYLPSVRASVVYVAHDPMHLLVSSVIDPGGNILWLKYETLFRKLSR